MDVLAGPPRERPCSTQPQPKGAPRCSACVYVCSLLDRSGGRLDGNHQPLHALGHASLPDGAVDAQHLRCCTAGPHVAVLCRLKLLAGAQRQARGGCIAGLKLVKTATAACSSGGAALAAADPAAAAGTAVADGEQDEEAAAAGLEAVIAASQAASQQQQQQPGAAGVAGPPAADVAGGEGRLYLYTFEQEVQYQFINSCKARQQSPQQQQQEGAAEGGDACSGQRAPHEQQKQQSAVGAAAGSNDSSSSKAGRCRRDGERTLQGIAAWPGEMLLLSADGMQVSGRVVSLVCVKPYCAAQILQLLQRSSAASRRSGCSSRGMAWQGSLCV